MVTTRRLLRGAGACLMTFPLVMCVREGGDGTGWTRQQHRSRRGDAWIGPSLLPSHGSPQRSPWWRAASHPRGTSEPSRPPSASAVGRRPSPGASLGWSRSLGCCSHPHTMPSTPLSSLISSSSSRRLPPTALPFARPDLRHLRHPSAVAAVAGVAGEGTSSTMLPPSVPWLAGHRIAAGVGRGRCAHRSRLSAVAAVSSRGDGSAAAAAAEAAYEGGVEELRETFEAAAGESGLLGLDGFRALPDVRELLDDGLLGDSELLNIWKAVPKADIDRVDFDGFAQAFACVDALFEVEVEEGGVAGGDGVVSHGGGVRPPGEADAVSSFVELTGSSEALLDLAGLLRWNEVAELMAEGLLTRSEVEVIWDGLPKVADGVTAAGASGNDRKRPLIDLQGFMEFDRKLSDLFEEDAEGSDDGEEVEAGPTASVKTKMPVSPSEATSDASGENLQPSTSLPTSSSLPGEAAAGESITEAVSGALEDQFAAMANKVTGGLTVLTLDGLLGWSEVSEVLDDGLLSREEVERMFQTLPKAGDGGSIDLKGFAEFATKLEGMFEEIPGDDEDEAQVPITSAAGASAADGVSSIPSDTTSLSSIEAAETSAAEAKERLVDLAKGEVKDCGMGCGEEKRAKLMEATEALVAIQEGNLVLAGDLGSDLIPALVGEWRLLYTSSNAMEYNQGLTGLVNTIPNAKFRGLRQILHADGMVFDAEYEEEVSIRDESEPLVITVTSDWEVKQTSSLITGKSTIAVSVSPKEIKYGFVTVRSERWKTLRAMTLLDIAYLDNDLRVMRGQTARQNLFVFERV